MSMTRREARAVLACAGKVERAVKSVLGQLSEPNRTYAEAYWAGHMLKIAREQGYGTMPLMQADATLDKPSKYELQQETQAKRFGRVV